MVVEVPSQFMSYVKLNDRGFLDCSFYRVEWVDLRKTHSTYQFQCRDLISETGEASETDDSHVSSIIESIADKALDPEIFGTEDELPLVHSNGARYEIVSGFHRLEALKRLKFDKVPVRIYQVPKVEDSLDEILIPALRFIALVENTHRRSPMKLNKRDRMKTLRKMLESPVYQAMSSLQLSKMTGVSDKTISKIRKELGVKVETIHTSDGKERSSSRKSSGRSESRVEILARENEELRRDVSRYKAGYEKLKVELGKMEGGVRLLEELVRILTDEDESEGETPVVKSRVEDGSIIDVEVREVRPEERLQLESPAPRDKPRNKTRKTSLFETVSRLIDDWTGEPGSESLNHLTGKNWSTYKRKLSPEEAKSLEDKARDKGLRVEGRGRPSKS